MTNDLLSRFGLTPTGKHNESAGTLGDRGIGGTGKVNWLSKLLD